MSKVTLELSEYDGLKNIIRKNKQKIAELEAELKAQQTSHQEEISKLVTEGKVRCIGIVKHPVIPFLVTDKKEYKNFDDVKAEVEEHFKQGLFDEELEKQKKEQLDNLIKQATEREATIDELRAEVARLKGRSLWERIMNK